MDRKVNGYMRLIDIEPIIEYMNDPEHNEPYGLDSVKLERMIRDAPVINYVPPACRHCGNHPANGGSGICHCILGNQVIY